ncbi:MULTISPECIES: response regulator [unclassified Tolypothrix]|uniref:response regulator n=1 Tax=unclassified Tolypothrix TaxID=2649714 RepID=UPI0005EAC0B9|nr:MULTISPECIES: response regulator transcription factor [unclassified Tolypothrix]BAY89110.1 LuxR family two component transcriptional regulator [Microchaete diplosiphon NIES-3275]EKF06055.1 response regulator [Tolypothrix sp. PCC 7601]MBE9086399.1 response regulator transcription factor [Tolypothrix sp. LEGE 11397]UYD29731.1 response regulator transcription factor [Tolypothrix sp. PCC 7712]UYD34353.1 response regulator transcription factor [Tolypothrix sp. PCC 7601]
MSEIKVVVIEDHNLTRIGLQAALQAEADIKIVGEAANATDGLQLLLTLKPDVATIDIGLPDMDGIELTRKYRQFQQQNPDLTTKILILTMQNSEEAVLAAFGAGADSYCMKDIDRDRLVDAVKTTYTGSPWIDPTIADIVLKQVRQDDLSGSSSGKRVLIDGLDSEIEKTIETSSLTQREMEVLELIVAGCDNAEIAQKLYLTIGTVKTHVRGILSKLCVSDRTQAAVRALRGGLVH